MVSNDFMGKDGFFWLLGVVEDREDPELASRVRVRCIGLHTDDKDALPTKDLPWAQVLAPTDTPSMAGMGNTPHFLVEGTHVFGFFLDGKLMQQPMVLGSIPGQPVEEADPSRGFFDPKDVYPQTTNEPDTNRLIRGSIGETHPALMKRRGMRQTKVPIATKPFLKTVQADAKEDPRTTWDEPHAKSEAPTFYPYNHVHESESGHIHEIDDTPGGERLLQQHLSGTFTEIHPEGTRVVKVVGKDYEIIIEDQNLLIEGDLNVTVKGNKKELIQGDYVLEVEGDMYTKIHKNQRIKVGARGLDSEVEETVDEDGAVIKTVKKEGGGGNREEEIVGSHAFNIVQAVKGSIGISEDGPRDYDLTIGGKESRFVNGDYNLLTSGNYTSICLKDTYVSSTTNMSLNTTNGIVTIKSGDKLNIKSATAMTYHTETTLTGITGQAWTHTTQSGDIRITGGPDIHLNP